MATENNWLFSYVCYGKLFVFWMFLFGITCKWVHPVKIVVLLCFEF